MPAYNLSHSVSVKTLSFSHSQGHPQISTKAANDVLSLKFWAHFLFIFGLSNPPPPISLASESFIISGLWLSPPLIVWAVEIFIALSTCFLKKKKKNLRAQRVVVFILKRNRHIEAILLGIARYFDTASGAILWNEHKLSILDKCSPRKPKGFLRGSAKVFVKYNYGRFEEKHIWKWEWGGCVGVAGSI